MNTDEILSIINKLYNKKAIGENSKSIGLYNEEASKYIVNICLDLGEYTAAF